MEYAGWKLMLEVSRPGRTVMDAEGKAKSGSGQGEQCCAPVDFDFQAGLT